LFELFRADFSDVAQHMTERPVLWITTLRLCFDAKLRKFQGVRVNPRDISRGGILFNAYGFKGGLRLYLVEALAQVFRVNVQPVRERLYKSAEVYILHVFAREDDIVDGARIYQNLACAVEDDTARRWDRQHTYALILRSLCVERALHYLKHVQAHA